MALRIVLVAVVLALVAAVVRTPELKGSDVVSAAADVPPPAAIVCRAPALGGRLPADVYLPASYTVDRGRRFPVVYFLHGLPASPQSYTQYGFVSAALAQSGQAAIVVAPQGARTADSDREYLNWSPTEDWPRAISQDLTACIDRRYRTIATRSGRALVGLSAGGYGALNIGLRNLGTFAAVESWSGYFAANDPSGERVLRFPSHAAQAAAAVPDGPALAHELTRWPMLIGFYVGREDDRFAHTNLVFDRTLRRRHIPRRFRTYPGGHTTALWQSHAGDWLTLAMRFLASSDHKTTTKHRLAR